MNKIPFNPLIYRTQKLEEPVEQLTDIQKDALSRFTKKIDSGYYDFEESPCLCGSKDGVLIFDRDRYALHVNTNLCKTCGMMWTSPRMKEDSLLKFYEEDYRSIYVGYGEAPDAFFDAQIKQGQEIYQFIQSDIKPTQDFTIFDIGCGAGGVLLPFKELGFSTFGSDLGSQYLQRGRAAGLVLEDGEASLLAKYGAANLVILSHVLEHFPFPLRSLKEIADLLADGGYVYVELPGVFSIHKTYGDTLLFLQNAHLYHFTLMSLTSLMAKAGFKLVRGDESIRALFQKDDSATKISFTNQYQKTLAYLYFVEIERMLRFFYTVRMLKNSLKAKIKAILSSKIVNHLKKGLG